METKAALPVIPEKLYFTIGEVAKLCQLQPHVLRYWEQEFNQLSPSKRRGNRRYYQRKDVILIRQIKHLLYEQGFTIEGARRKLSQEGKADNPEEKSTRTIRSALSQLVELLEVIEK